MKIVELDPKSDPLWLQLVERVNSDVFHSPDWARVLDNTYQFGVRARVILDESGQATAGLSYCQLEDIRAQRTVTLPFSDFCDPLVENCGQWEALTAPLLEQPAPYTIRCLHNDVALGDERFTFINRARWHAIDLELDLDDIWSHLHGSARRAIRKAERDGVTVRLAQNRDELRAFFELHLKVRKYKYQLVAQPYRFFEQIWEQFIEPGRGALVLSFYKDQVIGGIMFLGWRNTLYYKFNASDPEQISHRPNDLAIWYGIQYGRDHGYKRFDFGLSDWDQEGLVRYKRKYATEEKTISFLRHIPDLPESIQATSIGSLLPQLTDLFTDASVPDHVTEKAGEILYRYFT